ncbi:hypothetical protein [Acinetobacter bereziniae]|uniref:hypothetical protein n=1 Tax=Acinetobacter bereziniae TaxID=106648 RepID=UPI001250CB0D|nr:hypothetical protein [Acinetobacter bereziniae]MBI0393991.1 hypothetical protein [Acinetobacter bereziniae]MBJ9904753.1 hypothetical protein [Acinetobacter bereziniae]MCU4321185.1 hypothetical protein [Acinetobacter bereziniae]
MMIKYISTFCLCLYSCVSYASTSLNVKLENTSTLIVRKDKNIKKINLGEINGYKTNCNNSYLVVWGIPKKFKNSSPQNNEVVFYNLYNKKQRVVKTSHAIFDVDFYKTEDKAILNSATTNTEINLKTGEQSDFPEISQSTLNQLEVCKNLTQFKRYKE